MEQCPVCNKQVNVEEAVLCIECNGYVHQECFNTHNDICNKCSSIGCDD